MYESNANVLFRYPELSQDAEVVVVPRRRMEAPREATALRRPGQMKSVMDMK